MNNKFAESGDQTSTYTDKMLSTNELANKILISSFKALFLGAFSKFGKKLVVIQDQQLEILLAWSW